ncbi:hypothetical protein GCM10027074_16470 [Streptomyces deserti]
MQSPHPPRPPYPPRPGVVREESDPDLLARAGAPGEGPRALALLLGRHWRAAYEYAVICLASAGWSAGMAATAAFHRVLARPAGGALRPQLLAAVRDTVREWAADDRVCAVLPELRKPVGARGLRAARPGTPERRLLAERAFLALPGASQCLLWHTEVEAEPISVPAALLGVDSRTASTALEQAREQFRAGCVRAHRELAPTKECRFYNRLLDVPMRRGGALLPDVQRHLMACRYCRQAAEQLGHFEGDLDVLLAETVLGWGVRRYLDSRPGRGGAAERRLPPPPGERRAATPSVPVPPQRTRPSPDPRRPPPRPTAPRSRAGACAASTPAGASTPVVAGPRPVPGSCWRRARPPGPSSGRTRTTAWCAAPPTRPCAWPPTPTRGPSS